MNALKGLFHYHFLSFHNVNTFLQALGCLVGRYILLDQAAIDGVNITTGSLLSCKSRLHTGKRRRNLHYGIGLGSVV